MKKNIRKTLMTFGAFVLTAALFAGIFAILDAPKPAKAEIKTFILDAATDKGLDLENHEKKAGIDAGNYGTDGYFTLSSGNFRGNSGDLCLELEKREAGRISFTVSGTATLEIVISSNGSTNKSNVVLRKDDGTELVAVGQETARFICETNAQQSYKYKNLTDGTYSLMSTDEDATGSNTNGSRGFRVFKLTVTQIPLDEVPDRAAWNKVAQPVIGGITQDGSKLVVNVKSNIGFDGGDMLTVKLYDSKMKLIGTESAVVDGESFAFRFEPSASGTYTAEATLTRDGEKKAITGSTKNGKFVLPLQNPSINSVTNSGNNSVLVEWGAVPEATGYELFYRKSTEAFFKSLGKTKKTSMKVEKLSADTEYTFQLRAYRNSEETLSATFKKTVRNRVDRNWSFTYFGQSVNGGRNKMTDFDEDKMTFKLLSCTYGDDGKIIDKGGKFTAYYDGISYFYTKIDAAKENFELTATFRIDYINPIPDGQEGFGIVIRDSIGEYGVSNNNFETNSASLIATKIEATANGDKIALKDGLGVRFTYGLTEQNIKDGTMSTLGTCKMKPMMFESGNQIHKGDTYTLTVKKTNTGYHFIYDNQEEILYGVDKLLQIDPDHVYVGFAVARGCNVSVSGVKFKTSDPKTDPEGLPEPPPEYDVSLSHVSPTSSGTLDYILRFRTNTNGTAKVTNVFGDPVAENIKVTADQIVEVTIPIKYGTNTLNIEFDSDMTYRNAKGEMPGSASLTKTVQIECRNYDNEEFYVAPDAKGSGKGTKDDPMDILVAIAYVRPGQKIILMDGTYEMKYQIKIGKGNSGTKDSMKYLIADEGAHPVFDFSNSTTGAFVTWGDYWYFEGFDVTKSIDNVKGFQLAGNHSIVVNVNTYNCGDTGFQISGSSNDPKAEWPSYNTVINCTSHDNLDSAMNNADGFAAKLSAGEGNVFRGCVAYNNIDDGWDLYTKVETGPIGVVTIENCVAYNNGFLNDVKGKGDGNGFKLGGDGIAVEHVIKNCISFGNRTTGFTSNSNPAIGVYNCTAYGNGSSGFALYGKGNSTRNFKLDGIISMNNGSTDNIEQSGLSSDTNFLQSGPVAKNLSGKELTKDIFESVDTSIIPGRTEDGSIDMKGLATIKSGADVPAKVGARLVSTAPETPAGLITPTPEPTAAPTEAPKPTDAEADTPSPVPTSPEKQDDKTKESNNALIWIIIGGAVLFIAAAVVIISVVSKNKKGQ